MKKYSTLMLVLMLLASALNVYGQDEDSEAEYDPLATRQNPVPGENDSRAARSFSDTIASRARNHIGFSLNAIEGRLSNVFPNSLGSHSATLTAFSSSVFANFGGRGKSRLHFEYGAGYRNYSRQQGMSGVDYNGSIAYTYNASRRLRFRLSDTASSSLNDPFSSQSLSLSTAIDWTPSPSYDVLVLPQRITRNQAGGQLDYDFTRNSHFYVSGSYNSYLYGKQEFGDVDTVQVGVGLDQRITNWLSLSSSYSTYLNNVDERLLDHQIHRLEISRFRFMLSRNVEVFASGGVGVADTRGYYRTDGMFRAGITRTSEKNVINVNYQRTMISALGYSRVLPSDVVTLGVGQRLTSRTNFRLSSSYTRSSDFDYSGLLKAYGAGAQLEHALAANLFASANYTYQYQKNSIKALADVQHFDRFVAFVSLQFTWPSIRLRSE
jgi:hypothetical protein